ncbi:MAG TPA: SusC/RagA family TonB-linked outer membrane protein [Balneolaceae bacterium]|nr:SusC/RagA family TonB-linked outer membrane protein [Balneolaceae bacterium]
MVKKLLSLLSLCLFMAGAAFGQSGSLTGKVTDKSSGEALPGVNIFIPGLQRGAATDAQGKYTIDDIDYGTYTVRATYVGYKTYKKKITINQQTTTLNIQITSQTEKLNDVVVTAYGLTRQERSLTSSVQEVKGDQLAEAGNSDLVSSLAGKVAGVQIIGSPGSAIGGTSKIRIRGESGLSQSSPLIVVDGTPISNQSFSSQGRDLGNLAQDLNLDDIESVSVLKGAAAAAMYGNRAAGGVIVIKTKGGSVGERPFEVKYSNTTSVSQVSTLPNYQNKYAGGGTSSFIPYTPDGQLLDLQNGQYYIDKTGQPYNGQVDNALDYATDESWGPEMKGQMFRPWWSWYHADFTGDGKDDYGTSIPLEPHPNNVKNFYDNGVQETNSISISGGASNSSYRVTVKDANQQGVIPNSKLDKWYLDFNGSLAHSDKLTSKLSFNYVNTQSQGRPAQGYSPLPGNPTQSFNQWFHRNLDMSKLRQYQLPDGTYDTWNIISPSNPNPLYWNNPYFDVYQNVPHEDRDRFYGTYSLTYELTPNLQVAGKIHGDVYKFKTDDRVASGGLNQDWYATTNRDRREMNYEGSIQYQRDFNDWSVKGFLGGNYRDQTYNRVSQSTVGGLSVPNLYNISASSDRPNVSGYTQNKKVESVYGTVNLGYQDMVYADVTLRNDWSSALPQNNNSYLYYGFSGSFVFTELPIFQKQNILSFGKLRASYSQVGNDLSPYQIASTYNVQTPRGSNPALAVPNTRPNPNLKAAIKTDTELGLDLRFLKGRFRVDGTWYQSVSKNEILNLQVSPASGYSQALINAGKFTKKGVELQVNGTPVQNKDWNLDLTLNWSKTLSNKVNALDPRLTSRLLEKPTYFIGGSVIGLYAREGETWGKIIAPGYKRVNGQPEVASSGYFKGTFAEDPTVDHGTILPDWNGGFRANLSYKNFSFTAFLDFQKGGKFYSLTKLWNNYSGLGAETVGSNPLGNPIRDDVVDANGNVVSSVEMQNAGSNSGGVYVKGVDANGNAVEYLTNPKVYYLAQFYNKEQYIYDASYIKLRTVKLTYSLPTSLIAKTPLSGIDVSLFANDPLLIYATKMDLDPSIIQNHGNGFGWWEGGTVPGTRTFGATVNLTF